MKKIAIISSIVLLGLATVVVAADLAPIMRGNVASNPAGEQTTLYSQISNPGTYGAAAQDFEAAYDAYDCYVGDDFQVTWADGWQIEQIHSPGFYSVAGPAAGIVYGFYGDGGGFPGNVLCSGTATILSDITGDITSELSSPCVLPVTGTYWVSVAARLDYATGGQWYVSSQLATIGSIAHWYNPGDGFGNGCTTWSSCALNFNNPTMMDMTFELLGTEIPVELQSFGIE
ncbi:MAG TPA: hypothetical protein PKJ99_17315 [Thermoanaerobaculales bacterium]|nr:hypothetical protein [Thermoanaerobaculales bacterium]HPA82378.1 hypothetical protein [Thermoanaerobaculales bacterium]HQL29524.1 hypothetical protein [Thermoanaerobaculales bacterium]HQN95926.1 hypothetical protein [Thermoanaerobaculales bacterium]HQP43851.1 hypothetical protein [Thermoanaerobaculales bacterium]